MITVISGTNRKASETEKVAAYIVDRLRSETDEKVSFLSLTHLPEDLINEEMYTSAGQSRRIGFLQDEIILPADKFWFIFPEYNGGIPGILKLFIDALSVRDLKETFYGKKACLTGVSSGRAGNLRGMDHLTNILNYLQVVVLPNRLPISSIGALKDEEGALADQLTLEVISQQISEFLSF